MTDRVVKMLSKPHFKNGLKCNPVHDHGASCAIDTLLDSYYFGIYKYTKTLNNDDFDRTSDMVKRLEALCHFRDVFGSASCELREEIWNWCVANLPEAYSPKGRDNAVVIEGFSAFAKSAKCTINIDTESTCSLCEEKLFNSGTNALLTVSSTYTAKCDGVLPRAMEMEINHYARRSVSRKCGTHPDEYVKDLLINIKWPNVLFVELGVLDNRNTQTPPVRIDEHMTIGQSEYELKGSVQVKHGHFYCIVKHDRQYAVIDGMKESVSYFSSFSAAVHQREGPTQPFHFTATNHDAIYILFLQKVSSSTNIQAECGKASDYTSKRMSPGTVDIPTTVNNNCTSAVDGDAFKKVSPSTDKSLLVDNMPPTENDNSGDPEYKSHYCTDMPGHVSDSFPDPSTSKHVIEKDGSTCMGTTQQLNTESMFADSSTLLDTNKLALCHKNQTEHDSCETPEASTNVTANNMYPTVICKATTTCDNTTGTKLLSTSEINSVSVSSKTPAKSANSDTCRSNEKFQTKLITDGCVQLDVGHVKLVGKDGSMFASCEDVFHCTKMTSHVKKNGYKVIDNALQKIGLGTDVCFLFQGNRRTNIRLDALSVLLQSRIGNTGLKLQLQTELEKLYSDQNVVKQTFTSYFPSGLYDKKLKKLESELRASGTKLFTGHVTLSGGKVRYATKQDIMYLSCSDIFPLMGLQKHVQKEGYMFLDKKLDKLGVCDAFVVSGKSRLLIKLTAILELLTVGLERCGNTDTFDKLRKELIHVMQSETCMDILTRKQMVTPKKGKLKTPVSVNKSPLWKRGRRARALFSSTQKRRSNKLKTEQLKSALAHIYERTFNSKHDFLKTFASLIRTDRKDSPLSKDDGFDGSFTTDSITQILKMVNYERPARSRCKTFLDQLTSENHTISATDIVHLEANFSGTRLIEQLRQKLPVILPSQKEEKALKKKYDAQFKAILLPKRTSTGWFVDPVRLMELLSFKYWWLEKVKHWKVYGDGRAIGGRQSCFIGLSILNHEACLHRMSYQSPKEIYPIFVFYESDSRDNIEENLGFPSAFDRFIQEMQLANNMFYLSGDEMFLEAMLAAEGLGPLTKNGWNIFRHDGTEQKQEISPSTGMRTDLNLCIDRDHPDAILSSIPTCRVVLCILHAIARCVEKLVNLEVDNILSDGNKAEQRGQDAGAFVEEKIQNLQNNINKRGVRGGHFRIHFNSKGAPEPVSLNKTHAVVIISSPPSGEETEYPHVMSQVLDSQKQLVNPIPDAVKHKLELKNKYSEFELVQCIWYHFSKMITILQKDPEPKLRCGQQEDSTRVEDYSWGYSDEDREQYIHHAESFYQLYVWRYTYKCLTPYMIKLIDIAPVFMKSLPFPLARYESEGGEHLNYDHNRFYFQHTTRHGGKDKPDPLLSLFRNMFNGLAYSIGQDDTPQDKEARSCFNRYCKMHEAAALIQRWFRSVLQGRHQHNGSSAAVVKTCQSGQIFSGFMFVLCGTVPLHGGKKYTQSALKILLYENGARVRAKLPSEGKGVSTKRYTVIASPNMLRQSRIVGPIRQAVRRGFDVLSYTFITSSIEEGCLADPLLHKLDVTKLLATVTKSVSLQDRHFSKSVSLLTKLRKRCTKYRRKLKLRGDKKPAARSAALHYVLKKRAELQDGKKVTFWQSRRNLLCLFKEWKSLPLSEKAKATEEWQTERTNSNFCTPNQKNDTEVCTKSPEQASTLQISEPAYRSFFKTD